MVKRHKFNEKEVCPGSMAKQPQDLEIRKQCMPVDKKEKGK